MIKRFPDFSQLAMEQKEEIEKFTSGFEPYSDFNFTSLFAWNTESTSVVSILNDNLVIGLPDYMTGKTIYSILGHNKIDESLAALLGITDQLNMVPEQVVKKITTPEKFHITEDRDNFDYIYSLDDLATLIGNKYKKIRHKVGAANRHLAGTLVMQNTATLDQRQIAEITEVFGLWAKESKRHHEAIRAEANALLRLIKHSGQLNLLFTLLRSNERLVAFSVNEIINSDYAISHFEKALRVHDYIYSLIANQVAIDLLELNCRYINWEQDLGLEGLRKSKLSYRPSGFLKKYTVSHRPN